MTIEERLADVIVSAVKAATAPLVKRLQAAEARSIELERRIAGCERREYQGVWSADRSYAKGAMATRDGSIWHSNIDENRSTPGQSPNWVLAVKRGADGRR